MRRSFHFLFIKLIWTLIFLHHFLDYIEDDEQVPKNSSLVVKRMPPRTPGSSLVARLRQYGNRAAAAEKPDILLPTKVDSGMPASAQETKVALLDEDESKALEAIGQADKCVMNSSLIDYLQLREELLNLFLSDAMSKYLNRIFFLLVQSRQSKWKEGAVVLHYRPHFLLLSTHQSTF